MVTNLVFYIFNLLSISLMDSILSFLKLKWNLVFSEVREARVYLLL